jgi:hypothetical protein
MDMLKKLAHLNRLAHPHAQIFMALITAFILFAGAYYRMKHLDINDPIPALQSIKPTEAQQAPIVTGLLIRNFLDFDVLKNNFVTDAYVWFEFDEKQVKLQDIDDFSFSKATIDYKSKPYITKNNHLTTAGYNIRLKFPSNLNHRHFPIDNHRLYLILTNFSLSAHQVLFEASPNTFQVSPSLYTAGWKHTDHAVTNGVWHAQLDKSTDTKQLNLPRTIFSIDFTNNSFKRFILITLPLFFILFLSLFTLSLDTLSHQATMVSIPAVMLTALISYNFVIDSISPKVTYFTLSDMLFNLFLILNFMIFLVNTLLPHLLAKYRGLFVLIVYSTLLIFWNILLYWWA